MYFYFIYIMKKNKYMSWDVYFMSIAILSSFRSKDTKSQNGACIVNPEKKVVGVGYNGLPIGLDDSNPIFWSDDDNSYLYSKHSYVIHAEQNAIFNKNTENLKGCVLYVTLFPCRECAKSICQMGISKVIYFDIKPHHEDKNKAVLLMFKHLNISCIKFSDLNLVDSSFIDELKLLSNKYV